jgi:UDP-2,3-diacylglucosamine hydrolase
MRASAAAAESPPGTAPAAAICARESWRAIDFVSDLHLGEHTPGTFAAFERYLARTTADAVYVLGDLVELWVGDDALALPFGRRLAQILAAASRQRVLGFMPGNRDFLLGAAMREACGFAALPDPCILDAWGRRVLLTHGDALCVDDTEYQAFRAQVRTPRWQHEFLALPLAERRRRGAAMRRESESRRLRDPIAAAADIDRSSALLWLEAARAGDLVHGHTHRPGSEDLAPGCARHVLSDWELDGERPRAEVLRLTRAGFVRLAPAAAAH